jgi:peptidoglycan/LPS O-acetylase OafA/YrhL
MSGVDLRRMPGIDGLRALAVTAVFVYHADPGLLPGGFLGVDVFFVISGYLITSLLLAEFERTGGIRLPEFWLRRARRLLPALFLLLGVCLLVGATVERGKIGLRQDALAAIFYVANWRFVLEHESYFAQFARPPLLRHLWSLAVEEQFYLLWPPLLALGLHLRHRVVVPAFVAAAALASTAWMWMLYRPGADSSRVFYGTDTRAAPLLVGVLLAFVWKPGSLPRLTRRRSRVLLEAAGIAGLACVVAAFFAVHAERALVYHGGFLLLSLCAASLLASTVHPQGALGRLLARPVPRWLGERSYAIYLWHWPVMCFTRPGIDVHASPALVFALQAAITLVLADVSFRFVERPIRRGGLQGLRIPRASFAVAGVAIAALLGLAFTTPATVGALPPGIDRASLAASQTSASHLTVLPHFTRARVPRTTFPRSGPILAVGDSVMLGAESALTSTLGPALRIDAVVARQPDATIARLRAYRTHGTLPQRVVVHIGDNGPVFYRDWQALKAALAGVPLVVLVNVRVDQAWQAEVNDEMRQAIVGWRSATIADWYDASGAAGAVTDGTHTSPQGARVFAALISRALRDPNLGGVTR